MRSAVAAGAVFLASAAGTVGCLALIALTPRERVPVGLRVEDVARFVVLQASLTLVGALIVWRRPGNRVGWFLSAAAVCSAVQLFAAGYAVHGILGDAALPRAELAAWSFAWLGVALGLFLGLVVLSFPDGRFHSRRAKAGVALAIAGSLGLAAAAALRPGPLLNMPIADNPFGVIELARLFDPLIALASAAFVGVLALSVSVLWGRLRRSTRVEALQIKWVISAAALTIAVAAVAFPLIFVDWEAAKNIMAPGLSLVPLSIGVAILRHRLYDIDVLINRALVYGALSALLLATYGGSVIALSALLRPLTGSGDIAVAGSTLAVVALFAPLRQRIQRAVDRRFYRSRYDAVRTLEGFGLRLRDDVDLDSLRRDLVAVVHETMEPSHASVWLRPR